MVARRFPPDIPSDLSSQKYGPLAVHLYNLWKAVKDMSGGAPGKHADTHRTGGGDILRLDELGEPTDNTRLNASTTAHGLLLKLSGSSVDVLRGDGTWGAGGGGSGSVDDTMILLEFLAED